MKTVELVKGGKDIILSNKNKEMYVQKIGDYCMTKSIRQQLNAFLEGFYEIIPAELIKIFNYRELELIISGVPNIDLEDLKKNLTFGGGYNVNSKEVKYFFEIMEEFN